MPLYEYECNSCRNLVEVLVRTANDRPVCPDCGNKKLNRVLSVPAAPATSNGGTLPVAAQGEACGMPRCCGGGCQM